MGWITQMVFLPFSMYMIVFKFVCRKIVSCTVSRIVINIYNRLVYKIPVPEQTDRSRNSSGNQTDIIGSRNLSGNSEPRSRNNSGNRLRNSFEADNRSRHNSGQEVRSRHGSGNESRSRHSSGNTPGPGLLQRSDSIVQFPASPPGSASIGGRSRRSSSSSSSGRVIKIHVNKTLREEKLRSLQQKLDKLAAERNEQSSRFDENLHRHHLKTEIDGSSSNNKCEVDNRKNEEQRDNNNDEVDGTSNNNNNNSSSNNNNNNFKTEQDQPLTPSTRRRIVKLVRKRRAHTMPDIMITPRARTISEQLEEHDKIMPLPVIPKQPRWKSCNSLSSSSSSPPTSQYASRRVSINNNNNMTNYHYALKSFFTSASSPPLTSSDSLKDTLQPEIAAWQESVTQKQFGALINMMQHRGNHHRTSRSVADAHHKCVINGQTVIKTNNHFSGTSCKITVNSNLINATNGVKALAAAQNGLENGHLWQGLEAPVKVPTKTAT